MRAGGRPVSVLVTGAAGFVGFHVVRALAARGERVLGVDSLDDSSDLALKAARLARLERLPGFAFRRADLAEPGALARAAQGREIAGVVHLAGRAGVREADPSSLVRDNVLAQARVLAFCRDRAVRHLVHASSSAVYGTGVGGPHGGGAAGPHGGGAAGPHGGGAAGPHGGGAAGPHGGGAAGPHGGGAAGPHGGGAAGPHGGGAAGPSGGGVAGPDSGGAAGPDSGGAAGPDGGGAAGPDGGGAAGPHGGGAAGPHGGGAAGPVGGGAAGPHGGGAAGPVGGGARPRSAYGATKRRAELLARACAARGGPPVTSLRYFTLYGPWARPDTAAWIFAEAILAGRPVRLHGYGRMRRSFTWIGDAVAATLAALEDPPPADAAGVRHAVADIRHPAAIGLEEFVTVLESILGRRATRRRVPAAPGEMAADAAEDAPRPGFEAPTGIEEGLTRFVAWYLSTGRRLAPGGGGSVPAS